MFNRIVLFTVLLCLPVFSFAQIKTCSTDDHYQKMLKQYPQLAQYEAQFDAQVRQRIAEKTSSVATVPDTTTYDIPLVVHVIHDYGVEFIPDDVIYAAAAYWATVYVKQNADTTDVIAPFVPYIGNPNIRLHLATIDPYGKPTKGVVRFQSYITNNADDQAKFGQWPPNRYVNIWFVNQFGAEDAGAAAYAIYPSTAVFTPYYDGVIGLYDYVNYDKAIPHEIGHVLNLEHPWGNNNNPNVACGDDGVDDTPPTKGHDPVGCVPSALYDTTCTNGPSNIKTYTSADGMIDSIVHYPDTANSQNIMDYTYCQRMFTKGQVFRMRTALTNTVAGRNNLYTASNLAATGALAPMPDLRPVADFIVNTGSSTVFLSDTRTYFLAFNSPTFFAFKNWSWNDTVSSVSWSFSNGASTPTSSSITTVTNSFSLPGWVTVTLVATSNAGSDTLVNTHTVYAVDTAVAGGMGYAQPFTNAADIANWPMFNYYNNQFKWEFYAGAGYGGDNSCIRYRSFDTSQRYTGTALGDHDDFYTPAFNLTNAPANLFIDFFTAGARTSPDLGYGISAVGDSMEVDMSVNGGERWIKIDGFNSADLDNNGLKTSEFTPLSAMDWAPRTVSIPAAYRTENAFFRFRFFPGNAGNNLYLDNFKIDQFPAGVKEVAGAEGSFSIYPNPASNGCNLVFKTGNDGRVSYVIKDVTGNLIYEVLKTFAANSVQQEPIARAITPSAGMYFVTITVDGINTTQKLVVY